MRRREAAMALSAAALLLAAAAGCGAEAAGVPDERPAEPPSVRIATVRPVPDRMVIREVGRLEPWRRVTIAAEVSGRVTRLGPEVGDRISDSDPERPRIEIDRAALEATALAAEAAVAGAEVQRRFTAAQLGRVRALRERGQASESELERAEHDAAAAVARLEAAQAERATARVMLARAAVALPPGYRVTARRAEVGEVVGPGQPLLSLIDDRRLRLRFDVSAELLGRLRPGDAVPFQVEGRREVEAVRAHVVRVGPEADPASGRFPVEASVDNADGALLAGLIAVALLEVERSEGPLLTVPRAAVRVHLEQSLVAVIGDDGVVERRVVRRLRAPQLAADRLAIDGVAPGERVALDRLGELRTGDRVQVVGAEASTEGPPAAFAR